MKLTTEAQIINERFLGLSVVPLGSYLTDDMVRRSGLYVMNETERVLLTARQAAEIVARAIGDEVVVDRKVGSDVTELNALICIAVGPYRKRKVARPVSPSKRLFLFSDRVLKKNRLVDFVRRTAVFEFYGQRSFEGGLLLSIGGEKVEAGSGEE